MSGLWTRIAAGAAIALSAAAAWAEGLELGDPAPPLEILEWVKGDPVDLAAAKDKQVVVVEFWATWCGPCKTSIPHLSELQTKYAGKGVTIIGISNEKPDDVKAWMTAEKEGTTTGEKNGDLFKYPVAIDNMQNTTAAYRGAVGADGIPYAFIVDKAGNVAWHGHPMQMDQVLEKVLAGTHDVTKARTAEQKRREMASELQSNNFDKAAAAAEEILKLLPADEMAFDVRCQLFQKVQKDPSGYLKWMGEMVAGLQSEAGRLNDAAWRLATNEDLRYREPALALKAAKRAVELEGKEAAYIDTLARVYADVGLLDRAVETQKQAVAALDPKTSEDVKKQYQSVLAYYEACLALAKQQKPDAKTDPKKGGGKK